MTLKHSNSKSNAKLLLENQLSSIVFLDYNSKKAPTIKSPFVNGKFIVYRPWLMIFGLSTFNSIGLPPSMNLELP